MLWVRGIFKRLLRRIISGRGSWRQAIDTHSIEISVQKAFARSSKKKHKGRLKRMFVDKMQQGDQAEKKASK